MAGRLEHWLSRHQHPASRFLHAIGIPLLPWAGYLLAVQLGDDAWGLWWRPAGLVVLSYVLQWVGHRIEGNDMGELILAKKWIGKPYITVSPRYNRSLRRGSPSPSSLEST